MNLASHRTHLFSSSFQRGVSWIAAIVAALAFFLVFASLLLASYPIGSAVRGYFYGLTDVQNAAGIQNQLRESEIANFGGKSNATDAVSDYTEVISGNGTHDVVLQTSGIDAIVDDTWRNSSEDKYYSNPLFDKVALNSSSASEPEVPESAHLKPSKYNISSDNECDLYDGQWVHDTSGPLYTNNTCPILTQMQNCQGNGRPDKDYENWRWKPSKCQLPRFNAHKFLQLMKGKTLAFIGDSVARNQMESLLCILWQVETPKNRGNRRMQRWYFRSSSTFIVRIWSSWLVHQTSDRLDYAPEGVTKVHLDEADRTLMEFLPTFDVAVLSSGHWFAKQSVYVVDRGIVGGQLWWPDKSVAMKVNNVEAFGISVETVLTALVTHPNYTGLTIVRSYSPDHYQGGTWNTGGSCTGKVKPATGDEITENGFTKAMYEKQVTGFKNAEKKQKNRSFLRLMDITKAFSYRVDGHPGPYRNKDPKKVTVSGKDGRPPPQDCLHWCMPGPVDTWNELVMEILRGAESVSSSSPLS